ncbi:hypothetical protein [Actinoallomurus sp. NPDC050550]|uniref:hypothetical protein n=1 Tax=Actinoallomurus sp. NPDC050550 TaxID=3154937 RepID=UPI0033FDDE23
MTRHRRRLRALGRTGDAGRFRREDTAVREELRRRYDACSEWMFPSELRDGGTAVVADDLIGLTMRQNFAVTRVRMAGSLGGYECACTDIHAG